MVKSFTQLLLHRYRGKLDAEAEEMMHFIEAGSGRMQNLVSDLLSYSRVLHDREQNNQVVDLNLVLDETMFYFRSKLEETGAEVTREVLPTVTANGERIGLVLQNLLSNALKYQNGGPPQIHIAAARRETEWVISVRDNGIGFDPQYAERIFGLFKRLHRADEYPGTGVGLALCKQIVEQHGGRIWAESKLGEGATFFFSLPEEGKP
jgi:light-regulated signal transduction histidine kinase (bacteriophytochrome)